MSFVVRINREFTVINNKYGYFTHDYKTDKLINFMSFNTVPLTWSCDFQREKM